MYTTKFGY